MSDSTPIASWFEIPATDFDRAHSFYQKLLDRPIEVIDMGEMKMGMLSPDPSAAGGAIVSGQGCVPSEDGTTVYLNGGDDLAQMLARVTEAGGRILVPKTEIGSDFGFFAHFVDTEGNRVGLHSMS